MAKSLFTGSGPPDHLNALARFSIVSDNGHAFEFARQRATG